MTYLNEKHRARFTLAAKNTPKANYAFINCDFVESDFVGTNFRGTKFINCSFDKCLFQSTNRERTVFKNCKYNCCYLNGNSVDCFKCLSGITVINLKKTQLNVLKTASDRI